MRRSLGPSVAITCTALTGTASASPAARTSSASVTSTVSGRRSEKRVPAPGSVDTSTSPLRRPTLVRTMSMPTPRPAVVVTSAAVLKPGRKIRSSASLSDIAAAASAVTKPCATARRRSRSASMPRPSSATSTTTNAPRWLAVSETTPAAGLPAAWRSSGSSMPWATAFCARWSSGSTICSMTLASSSTLSPLVSIRTLLPAARAASWPCRTKRVYRLPIGTSRARPSPARTSPVSRCTRPTSSRTERPSEASSVWTSAMSEAISDTLRANSVRSS